MTFKQKELNEFEDQILANKYLDTNTETKLIREAMKKLCRAQGLPIRGNLRVRHDRGTAYGWIHATMEDRSDKADGVYEALGMTYGHGGRRDLISPDETDNYVLNAIAVLRD